MEGSEDKIYLHKEAVLTSTDIADVRVAAVEQTAVELTFTDEGKKKLAKATEEHLGKALAIVVDGKVIAAPNIRAKIADRALISVSTKAEAERIATGFKK